MPTAINQYESNGRIILRVTGEMMLDDALLLEKIITEISPGSASGVAVDLADLDFLDSDSASVLRRLQKSGMIEIEGLEVLVQSSIDLAERNTR